MEGATKIMINAQTSLIHLDLAVGILLAVIYVSLLLLEQKWPLRKRTRPMLMRAVINLTMTAMVYVIASIMISPVAHYLVGTTQGTRFGFVPLISSNTLLQFALGFLLLDVTFYYWHRLNHVIPLLWRFHNVHHIDPDLDVTTSMRFHIVEIAYSSIFRLVQLALIGTNPITFFCYTFFFQANTFFQHSNIKLPIGFERVINKIIVTPRMHGIHHSNYRGETNRNYGVVFSFWDRLHKTMKLNVPQHSITIGVFAYLRHSDNQFINLLLMPFKKQRQYWLVDGEDHKDRSIASVGTKRHQLSE